MRSLQVRPTFSAAPSTPTTVAVALGPAVHPVECNALAATVAPEKPCCTRAHYRQGSSTAHRRTMIRFSVTRALHAPFSLAHWRERQPSPYRVWGDVAGDQAKRDRYSIYAKIYLQLI